MAALAAEVVCQCLPTAVSTPAVCLIALWLFCSQYLHRTPSELASRWEVVDGASAQPPAHAHQMGFARPKRSSVKKMHVDCAFIVCMLTQLALWLIPLASAIAFNKPKAEVSPHREQSPPGCRMTYPAAPRVVHSWEQMSALAVCTPIRTLWDAEDLYVCCFEVWRVLNKGTGFCLKQPAGCSVSV